MGNTWTKIHGLVGWGKIRFTAKLAVFFFDLCVTAFGRIMGEESTFGWHRLGGSIFPWVCASHGLSQVWIRTRSTLYIDETGPSPSNHFLVV